MPKAFPPEFRRDVVAVARTGEASTAQVARDFGVSESCLARWLRIADREDGLAAPAGHGHDDTEVRELRRRNKLLEQENEILRRATAYFARDVLPLPSLSPRIGLGASAWALRYDGVLLLVMIHFVVSPRGSGGG